MLTIICGEDSASSRRYFQSMRQEYAKKGYELIDIAKNEFENISIKILEHSSLFFDQRVFFSDNLVKYLKKNRSKAKLSEIDSLVTDKSVIWLNWEELSTREITNPKKAIFKEFKMPESIFVFLDSLYPGNLRKTSDILSKISETLEEGFIFAMVCRHVRSLLLAKSKQGGMALPIWQKGRLIQQANYWDERKRIGVYRGLAKLDSAIKTSANAFGILKSLEVLLMHFI